MEVDEEKPENSTKIDKAEIYAESVKECFAQLRQEIVTCMPENLWTDLTPVFFTSFWTMDNYDLKVPTMAYNREIIKLKEIIKEIDGDKTSDSRTRRSKAREKDRCVLKIEQIREEQKRHMRHVQCVEKRLEIEKEQWLDAKKNDTVTKMLQHCVFKRAVFSAEDSMYCANFILKMHYLSTPHFQTLLFLDRVFTDTSYTIGALTEQQAIHYGRFLNRLLEEIIMWHSSKESYTKHCSKYYGFITVLRQGTTNGENSSEAQVLDYEDFRHVCNKWQYKMMRAATTCLESSDYVQQRNVLVILPRLLPFFPKIEPQSYTLTEKIEALIEQEKNKRQDLRVKAMGYLSLLKINKKNTVPVEEFHIVSSKVMKKNAEEMAARKKALAEAKVESDKKDREKRETTRERTREKLDRNDRDKSRNDSMDRVPSKKRARIEKATSELDEKERSRDKRRDSDEKDQRRRIRDSDSRRDRRK